MVRVLIGSVLVVVVLAIVAVVAVALMNRGDEEVTTPNASASVATDKPVDAEAALPEGGDDVLIVGQAPKAADEAPATEETAPAEKPKDGTAADAKDGDDRVAAILDSLSNEEEEKLLGQLQRRRMRRWQEKQKYQLPSGQMLYALKWHDQGKHKLDDTQKARIEQFDQVMKPKLETALQTMWDREADIRQQINDLNAEGRREDAMKMYKDLGEVNGKIHEAKTKLDTEYKEMLRQVLTDEQMDFVEARPEVRFRTWVGGQNGGQKKEEEVTRRR